METFEITGRQVKTIHKFIKAASQEEAIKRFLDAHPKFDIEHVGNRAFIGFCELTGKPILEGDDYVTDSEGVRYLREDLEKSLKPY